MQYTYKDKKSLYGDSKLAKIVKFDEVTQEVNTIKPHDEPIPKKKKGKKQKKNPKSDQANADPSEDRLIYGIDHLNLGEPAQDSENDFK